jgi:hypothetical protein
MKKNWRLLACLFALPALPLIAAEIEDQETALEVEETAAQYMNKKTPVGAQKSSSDQKSSQGQMPEEESIHSMPMITPSVAPHVMDGTDTYVTLDFIWWKAVVGGMEYAFSGVVDNGSAVSPFGASTGKGNVEKPDFKFQPGFKAGIGVNLDHDGWDLFAQYTYLSSPTETSNVGSNPISGVGATNLQTVYFNDNAMLSIPLVNASCVWKQNFSVVDFELGRDYFISRYLTLRPLTGLKTGWINETSKVSMVPTTTVQPDGASTNKPTSIVLTYRQNMWGIGVRTGLNAGWHVTKNWSFYNDFTFTAFWADFKINQKQDMVEPIGGAQTHQFTHESLQTVIPVLEAGLGLSFITWWEQSRYRFEARAGWEQQIWLDFNHFMTLGGTGNFTLQGLTVKAALNF